jgi:quercetin dioxygenase-like cupin family protein
MLAAVKEVSIVLTQKSWFTALLCLVSLLGYCKLQQVFASSAQAPPQRARVAFFHALPSMDGGHLEATIVEVAYGPGESSKPHTHPCAVIGYILEGTYRTQVKGEPEAIYKAGESFYEAPNGVHLVSANASQTAPLKFLAYFTCDHHAPLSTDVPEHHMDGEKP